MSPEFLVAEGVRREDGVSPASAVHEAGALRVTVGITRIVEQESLEVVIEGASDFDDNWLPVAVYTQKFYCGSYAQQIDLSAYPWLKRIRAKWKMHRWHGHAPVPLFQFFVAVEEVAAGAVRAFTAKA
jgi:hypothetical protein